MSFVAYEKPDAAASREHVRVLGEQLVADDAKLSDRGSDKFIDLGNCLVTGGNDYGPHLKIKQHHGQRTREDTRRTLSNPIHFMISRFQLKVSVVGHTMRALAAQGSPNGPCLMRV